MASASALLRFVAKAALNHIGFGVAGDFAVEVLPEMANGVWSWWSKDRTPQQLRDEVQAVAALSPAEARQLTTEVVTEEAAAVPGLAPEKAKVVATFVEQLPLILRQSQRRPSDPSGKTVSSHLALTKPEDLLQFLPQRLPRFKAGDRPLGADLELVELLGVGGFGEVWKAKNPYFSGVAPVALKFCTDAQAARTLRYEASVLNQLMSQGKKDGIVQLQQSFIGADPPCLAYELVEGGDLAGAVSAHQSSKGPLPSDAATRIVLRLARAVGQAHKLNPPVVHRDLKPANVLVRTRSGGEKDLLLNDFLITDFGIGAVVASQVIEQTQGGGHSMMASVAGAYTPLYASPQQVAGALPDPRDDVHALGVIWYQMLVGDLNKSAPAGTGWQKPLAERGMSAKELDLIQSCFDESPSARPRDANELADLIERVSKQKPPGTKTTKGEPMSTKSRLPLEQARVLQALLPVAGAKPSLSRTELAQRTKVTGGLISVAMSGRSGSQHKGLLEAGLVTKGKGEGNEAAYQTTTEGIRIIKDYLKEHGELPPVKVKSTNIKNKNDVVVAGASEEIKAIQDSSQENDGGAEEEIKEIQDSKPWEELPLDPKDKEEARNQQWWKDASDRERAIWWWKFVGPPTSANFWIETDDEEDQPVI